MYNSLKGVSPRYNTAIKLKNRRICLIETPLHFIIERADHASMTATLESLR